MEKIKVFLDTDVIISSLLSDKGASYAVLRKNNIKKIISSHIQKEMSEVSRRLDIKKRLPKGIVVVDMDMRKDDIMKKYGVFVHDMEDAHVVLGADISDSMFLLSYNIRDYKIGKIKDNLGIIVMTPGNFLQYLRSLEKN